MQFLANALALASVYGLLALGYVIIYRASRVINMAHGDFMMLGGYFLFTILSVTKMHGIAGTLLGTVGALALSFLVGLLLYRLLIHKMLGQPVFSIIMVTIALSIVVRGLATFIWGATPNRLITMMGIGNPPIHLLGGADLSRFDLLFIVACAVCLIGAGLFYKFIKVGVQMRAASEIPLLAAQRGINIYLLFAFSWSTAAVLAALAGILYGGNLQLMPEMGVLGLKALPVALVGGMYSILGIIPAALIIACSELAVAQFYDPLISGVIPMVILLIALIIRPWGIFGKEEEIERV